MKCLKNIKIANNMTDFITYLTSAFQNTVNCIESDNKNVFWIDEKRGNNANQNTNIVEYGKQKSLLVVGFVHLKSVFT